jgi:hypothetical protein
MIKVITPPQRFGPDAVVTIFLAGSIEMGQAKEWQKEAIQLLEEAVPEDQHHLYQILNPRRPDWDSTWEQKYENPHFYQQVKWERKGLQRANFVLMVFDPATKSPVTLMELGEFYERAIIVCPEGFWRKGNVDIFCEDNNVPQKDTLIQAIDYIIENSSHLWE